MKLMADISRQIAVCLIILLSLDRSYCIAQNCPPSPRRISLPDFNDLIKRQYTDQTIVNMIRCNGLGFTPSEMMVANLQKKGGYPKTAEELKVRLPIYIKVPGTAKSVTRHNSISLSVEGEIIAKIFKRERYTVTTAEKYHRTPGGNCKARVPFDETVEPRPGYNLINVQPEDVRTRAKSRVEYSGIENGIAHVKGIVEGTDDFLGYCKEPGEIWYKIRVTGEKLSEIKLDAFKFRTNIPAKYQLSFNHIYPYLPPTTEYERVVFAFNIKVTKYQGGRTKIYNLSDANPETGGIKAKLNTQTATLSIDAENIK